jgi:hypothetical protein
MIISGCCQFQSTRRAGLHAARIAPAEVAFDRLFQIRVDPNHLNGTVAMTQTAGHAFVVIDHHGAGNRISFNGIHRTNRGAIGIGALAADRREVVEILARMRDAQKGPVRIVSPQQALAARQLAELAARTQIEMRPDKNFPRHGVVSKLPDIQIGRNTNDPDAIGSGSFVRLDFHPF